MLRNLLESELFGYEEGAFTGARRGGKRGLFELAHRGTIFLDEIGDMPLGLQARLLRVLEQKEVMRLGSDRVVPVDVRVIVATHKDLKVATAHEEFREDLYYRLAVLRLRLPPLRERKDDIQELVRFFIREFCSRYKKQCRRISSEAMRVLVDYPWPGNVRELRNVVEQLVTIAAGREISRGDVEKVLFEESIPSPGRHMPSQLPGCTQGEVSPPPNPTSSVPGPTIAEMEEYLIRHLIAGPKISRSELAQRLGISRTTLWRKLRKLKDLGKIG